MAAVRAVRFFRITQIDQLTTAQEDAGDIIDDSLGRLGLAETIIRRFAKVRQLAYEAFAPTTRTGQMRRLHGSIRFWKPLNS
jgi:hypothetical protein